MKKLTIAAYKNDGVIRSFLLAILMQFICAARLGTLIKESHIAMQNENLRDNFKTFKCDNISDIRVVITCYASKK